MYNYLKATLYFAKFKVFSINGNKVDTNDPIFIFYEINKSVVV